MTTLIREIEEKDFQASGYVFALRIKSDPNPYNYTLDMVGSANDPAASDEEIWDDILKRHAGAWRRLAEL